MSIFVQHSHGKSDKIDTLIEKEFTTGIILSPKGESSPQKMAEVIKTYSKNPNLEILFDPHFHLGLIENCTDTKIKDYPYYISPLTAKHFSSPQKIINYVSSTLEYQIKNLNLSKFISPTCIIESFETSLASILMAQSSVDYANDNNITKSLYVSFVISENAFRGSKDSLDDFITNITSIDNLDNVYLVIDKINEGYSQQMDADILQNILYFVYSLSNRNNINIICGYSDLIGLVYLTAGAKILATGWSQKTRYFSKNNYKEMSGGSQPKPRYTSIPLLNSIFNVPELQTIKNLGYFEEVLSNTSYDSILIENDLTTDAWNRSISYYHHMECINILAKEIENIDNIEQRIDLMLEKINNANILYTKLIHANVPFDTHNDKKHLKQWKSALENFKEMII